MKFRFYLLFILFGTHNLFSQSIQYYDSLFQTTNNEIKFLYSLISENNNYFESSTEKNIAQSISYFLLFNTYDQKNYKIQILEKGLDNLKKVISQDSAFYLKELYDELFNIYYNFKSGEEINNKPEIIIKEFLFNTQPESNYLKWLKNKFWSKK
ncbi:MAG TPA: hypothetical protein VIR55_05380 [Ignavibacteria bacterium]